MGKIQNPKVILCKEEPCRIINCEVNGDWIHVYVDRDAISCDIQVFYGWVENSFAADWESSLKLSKYLTIMKIFIEWKNQKKRKVLNEGEKV